MSLKRDLGLPTAFFIVLASMVGTGIFAATGNVLAYLGSPWKVMLVWMIGGAIALCGALSYAELSSCMPESGGEYLYLRKIFGLLPAFLSGWVSLVVGFSASIAFGASVFYIYLGKFMASLGGDVASLWNKKMISILVVSLLGAAHLWGARISSGLQNFLSIFKLSVIVLFIIFGLFALDYSQMGRLFAEFNSHKNFSHQEMNIGSISSLGIALLIISFCYSGWNAASYIAEEVKNPEKNLPRSLILGCLFVLVLYLFVNFIFLISVPGESILSNPAVAELSVNALFSEYSAMVFNFCTLLILLSSISVQMLIGPRVYYAMARDRVLFLS